MKVVPNLDSVNIHEVQLTNKEFCFFFNYRQTSVLLKSKVGQDFLV